MVKRRKVTTGTPWRGLPVGRVSPAAAGHVLAAVEYEDNEGTGGCYTREWCAREYQDVTNPGTATVPKLAGYPANNILPGTHTVRRCRADSS